jgi:hypothetical protein
MESTSDIIELSCRGEPLIASLKTLKKIRGSRLEQMLSGKVELSYNKEGKIFLDYDRQEVIDILNYCKSDRTWLPDAANKTRRAQAEANIKRLGLDKGLTTPSTLMTNLAKEYQKVLDTEPNFEHFDSKAGLELWKKHGPVKLSWLALYSTVPVDLDDEKFKIDYSLNIYGNQVTRVICKDNKVPDVYL